MQKDFVYLCGMTLKLHHAGQDQSRCLALRMWTRQRIFWGKPLQVLVSLIHHLVRFGIFVDPMVVGQTVVTHTERALGGPADHRELVFRSLVGVVHRAIRPLLFDGGFGPTAALGFPPIAQSRSGLDRLDSSPELFSIRETLARAADQLDNFGSLGDVVEDRLCTLCFSSGCGSDRRSGELSIKGQSISRPEVSLSGLCDHLDSQSLFRRVQAGLCFFLLLEQGCALSIRDISVSRRANSLRKNFIALAELNHLGMDGQLRLLLRGQLCRCARIGCQAGKPGRLLYHFVGWAL